MDIVDDLAGQPGNDPGITGLESVVLPITLSTRTTERILNMTTMRTFSSLFTEAFFDGIKAVVDADGRPKEEYAEVFINPTRSELETITKPGQSYMSRFGKVGHYYAAIVTATDFFVWDRDKATHAPVIRLLKRQGKLHNPWVPSYLYWFPKVKLVGLTVADFSISVPMDDNKFLTIAQANPNMTRLGSVEIV